MRIIVTGGAGFIGSNLVDLLIEKKHSVVILDNLSTGSIKNVNEYARFHEVDIQDVSGVLEIFEKQRCQIVFHLAAQTSVQQSLGDPISDCKTNILGTINILEACKRTGIKKMIFASSAAVYGEPHYLGIDEHHPVAPISCYGLSKLTSEEYIKLYSHLYGLDYTILRYANVYGIRQEASGESGVVAIFLDRLLNDRQCEIFGDGSTARDFVYVADVARANHLAIEKGSNEIINIGTGIHLSLNTLYQLISANLRITKEPIYEKPREGDIQKTFFNIIKAQEVLNFKPQFSLEQGIGIIIKQRSPKPRLLI